jgi:hypothetical protein
MNDLERKKENRKGMPIRINLFKILIKRTSLGRGRRGGQLRELGKQNSGMEPLPGS